MTSSVRTRLQAQYSALMKALGKKRNTLVLYSSSLPLNYPCTYDVRRATLGGGVLEAGGKQGHIAKHLHGIFNQTGAPKIYQNGSFALDDEDE